MFSYPTPEDVLQDLGDKVTDGLMRATTKAREDLAGEARVMNGMGDVLERLATALGVSPRFIERAGPVRGALAVDAHMRRRRTSKATVWRQLEARLNAYRIHAASVFEDVSMRAEQTVPVIDPVDVAPNEAALMVRAQWRLPIGPVRYLVRWLEAAGCLVFAARIFAR